MAYTRPSPNFATELVARRGYSGVGGTVSDIGTGFKDFLTGTIDVIGHGLDVVGGVRPQQPVVAAQEGPPWGLIAGIGAVGLVAVLLLRRK